jgi:hypothetical protein
MVSLDCKKNLSLHFRKVSSSKYRAKNIFFKWHLVCVNIRRKVLVYKDLQRARRSVLAVKCCQIKTYDKGVGFFDLAQDLQVFTKNARWSKHNPAPIY